MVFEIEHIEYEFGLDFDDVTEYIPTLTIDNQVITDVKICQIGIKFKNMLELNYIFVDLETMEYCFNSICEALHGIGDIFITYYKQYSNIEDLLNYIKEQSYES